MGVVWCGMCLVCVCLVCVCVCVCVRVGMYVLCVVWYVPDVCVVCVFFGLCECANIASIECRERERD